MSSTSWHVLIFARLNERQRLLRVVCIVGGMMLDDSEYQPYLEAIEKFLDNPPSTRDGEIVCMRYGLRGQEPQTLQRIADYYQLSRERVRQVITEFVVAIRQTVKEKAA